LQNKILEKELTIYICEGEESEIKEWFETINIAGVPLNQQERRNAAFYGPFVTLARAEFSNSQNANLQKWSAFVRGSADRQEILECALDWVASSMGLSIDKYMSIHRHDTTINELQTYFETVITWADNIFNEVYPEMRGLEWDRLYEQYHNQAYNPQAISERVKELYAEEYVRKRSGIFEFVLGGEQDKRLLEIRIFEESVKKARYQQQTDAAKAEGLSNCPLCALGTNNNHTRIWKLTEMDADHVTAWSKGGATDITNCQMLCQSHNRAKGNK